MEKGRIMEKYGIIKMKIPEVLDFTALPGFFVSNLLLVQSELYYFSSKIVSFSCSSVL